MRHNALVLVKTTFFAMLFILSGCAAYDLGSAGSTSYEVPDVKNPKWDEGISLIVNKKCATCHTTGNPWYKPKNTPSLPNATVPDFGLDNIGSETFFKAQNGLLESVKTCIESVCGTEKIPMPPNYATPLSKDEKEALLNFVVKIIPTPVPGAVTLSSYYQNNCARCHGADGQSNSYPKIGGSRSQTFAAYKQSYTTLPPMSGPTGFAKDYTDADAQADLQKILARPQ